MRTVRDQIRPTFLGCFIVLLFSGAVGCSDNGDATRDSAVTDSAGGSDLDAAVDAPVDTRVKEDVGAGDDTGTDSSGDALIGDAGNLTCPLPDGSEGQRCGETCTDVKSDPNHCGSCGAPVGIGKVCVGGIERAGCPTGFSLCGGRCLDVSNDPKNCGGCGNPETGDNICAPTERCEMGADGKPTCMCPLDGSDRPEGIEGPLKPISERRWLDCREPGATEPNCVDTWSDPNYCGGCGEDNACDTALARCYRDLNETPPETSCFVDCPADYGFQACGNACVDLATDTFNCGACGKVCPPGEGCIDSKCVCLSQTTECGGRCVNFKQDVSNCGGCTAEGQGQVCGGLQSCQEAEPVFTCRCPAGRATCGDDDLCATNTVTDNDHCGECDSPCLNNTRCIAGVCGCPEGTVFADFRCVDPQTDPFHCGGFNVCGPGDRCIDGKCEPDAEVDQCPGGSADECTLTIDDVTRAACVPDKSDDLYHCGSCGRACGRDQLCREEVCVCANGGQRCDGQCVDTQNDARYCGSCTTACAVGQVCVTGECVSDCPPNRALCEGRCVDTQTDGANCGLCGQVCQFGLVCRDGACVEA